MCVRRTLLVVVVVNPGVAVVSTGCHFSCGRLGGLRRQGSPGISRHTAHSGVAVDGSSRLLILLRISGVQAAMLRSSSSNSEFTSSAVRFINVIFTLRRVQWFLSPRAATLERKTPERNLLYSPIPARCTATVRGSGGRLLEITS